MTNPLRGGSSKPCVLRSRELTLPVSRARRGGGFVGQVSFEVEEA